ncbi:MAG: ferritin family protein [Dehalococcoidia bacterium]|nr:ferritin family protein [Dehalococcoidia bacterium]
MTKDIGPTLEILKQAIAVERQGLDFYRRAADRTRNAAGKAFFASLVEDEKRHERILLVEYDKVKSGAGFVEAATAVRMGLPEIHLFPEGNALTIPPDSNDLEVIQLAINFEKRGHDMYLKAAESIGDLTGKAVYQYLARWEAHHRDLLEKALKQLSADGTWLVLEKERPLLDGGP